MSLQLNSWYHLPDGTRVRARDAGGGAVCLDDMHGTPLYYELPGSSSLFHLIFDPQQQIYFSAPCDLTTEDLTPEARSNLTIDFDGDRPMCPHCHTTMQLGRAVLAYDIYYCSSCGIEIQL